MAGGHSDKLTSGVKYEGKLHDTEDRGLCKEFLGLLRVFGNGFWVTRRSNILGMYP